MRNRRWWGVAFAAVLVVVFGYRAAVGVIGGAAYARGVPQASEGDYELALPALERGAVGLNRLEALWLAAEVRLGVWDQRVAAGSTTAEDADLLNRAAAQFMEAISVSPASAWPWAGLASVYDRRERAARADRVINLDHLSQGRWMMVGRSGRVAVGMQRSAVEHAPGLHIFLDELALVLLEYGIVEEAMEVVEESARLQPMYAPHLYRSAWRLPPEVLDHFAEASRGALGRAPFLTRQRHLVSLAELERLRKRFDQAEEDLRSALEEPCAGTPCDEAHFVLGLVLLDQGKIEEAKKELAEVLERPQFHAPALSALARAAEKNGQLPEALGLVRELRWEEPTNLGHALNYARIARRLGEWEAAEEALRWAALTHPENPAPLVALVETHIEEGDLASASSALRELQLRNGAASDLARLRSAIDAGASGTSLRE